jgi:Domain of unknown function (DUF4913)
MTDTTAQQLTDLYARVNALEAWRTHQSDLLDDLLNSSPHPDPGVEMTDFDAPPEPIEPPAMDGTELIDWVHRTVTAITARPLRGEHAWCPRWYEHPEALFRFTALHRAWTELAPEPGAALSIWIRDHLDPCLRELLSPPGPFVDCTPHGRFHTPTEHTPLATLPTAEP